MCPDPCPALKHPHRTRNLIADAFERDPDKIDLRKNKRACST